MVAACDASGNIAIAQNARASGDEGTNGAARTFPQQSRADFTEEMRLPGASWRVPVMQRKRSVVAILMVLTFPALLIAGHADAAGQLAVAYALDPAQPVAGQPTTITTSVSAVGGPLTIALVRAISISAVSDSSGMSISAAAVALSGRPGSYTASLTFPSAGLWHLATENFQNAQGDTLDVTVLDAPPSELPACRAADLTADAQWQGALGLRIGTVTVTNSGGNACALAAYPTVGIVDAQGRPVPTEGGAFTNADDAGGEIVLQPGQQAATDVQWSNRCPQATASDTFLLNITLPGGNGAFTVPTSVPPCLGDMQPSRLNQRPFTLRSDAVQLVRDYYAAINDHTYPKAYALFGMQMRQNQSAADFAAGFATTQQDDLHIRADAQNGDRSIIAITLVARTTDGGTQRYTGTYTVAPENGALKIVAASIAPVPPSAA
jgi:hypothetical protein